jgi:hypothetical protein
MKMHPTLELAGYHKSASPTIFAGVSRVPKTDREERTISITYSMQQIACNGKPPAMK